MWLRNGIYYSLHCDMRRDAPDFTFSDAITDEERAAAGYLAITPDMQEYPDGVAYIANELQQQIEAKQYRLWQAADTYERNYISGVAIGLLTIGVIQQLPKALAVAAWSASLWTEYYARKEAVSLETSLNLDFSSFGPIPFSVPELRTELGM